LEPQIGKKFRPQISLLCPLACGRQERKSLSGPPPPPSGPFFPTFPQFPSRVPARNKLAGNASKEPKIGLFRPVVFRPARAGGRGDPTETGARSFFLGPEADGPPPAPWKFPNDGLFSEIRTAGLGMGCPLALFFGKPLLGWGWGKFGWPKGPLWVPGAGSPWRPNFPRRDISPQRPQAFSTHWVNPAPPPPDLNDQSCNTRRPPPWMPGSQSANPSSRPPENELPPSGCLGPPTTDCGPKVGEMGSLIGSPSRINAPAFPGENRAENSIFLFGSCFDRAKPP